MKEDFKSVLQGSLQKKWDKVQRAMESFSYFDKLDSVNYINIYKISVSRLMPIAFICYINNGIVMSDDLNVTNSTFVANGEKKKS